jgi:ABC-2 type transport system ATP-binding protein
MDLIKFQNISVKYKNLKVLDNLSFTVENNEIFGILGPNGSGKTTIFKVLLGIKKKESGNIGFETKISKTEMKRLIGFCPQENSFQDKLTVSENIKYFANLYGLKGDLDLLARETAESLGIGDKINECAENLSGGMKRRLNIACGILHKPRILILDEPSATLDPISRKELWKLIEKINQSGTTIIIATNIMEEVETLCDRIVMLKDGRKVVEGNIGDIRRMVQKTKRIMIYFDKIPLKDVENILYYITRLEGILYSDYTEESIGIRAQSGKINDILRDSLNYLKQAQVEVKDVSIEKSSILDVFEMLVTKK